MYHNNSYIQELRRIGKIRYQHLVPYFATTEDEDGSLGVVMPLIPGQSLRAYLQNISLSLDRKLTLVCGSRQTLQIRRMKLNRI